MKKVITLFIAILFLAAFLRLWHLGGVPISPNWDEAAIGYNAYSILKTGMDEHGVLFPVILQSFGNYTPAFYAYLAIPAIYLFNLTVFAVRLPSALFGIAAVFGTFFLAKELLSLRDKNVKKNTYLSLLVMFLLAISPWHIQFSRVAYESSIAFTLCVWGLLFFLLGLKNPRWYIASAIAYGLSINTYHSPRLFVPLFLLGLLIIFREKLLTQKKQIILPCIIWLLFLTPILYFFLHNEGYKVTGRYFETNIFSDIKIREDKNPTYATSRPVLFSFFEGSLPKSLIQITDGYLSHFSPKWMFVTGDNDRHHAPSTGLLYLWEAPFLLVGLLSILLSRGKFRSVFFLWLLLAPVPASLTSEVPHAVRTLIFLPSLQIAVALGIERIYLLIKSTTLLSKIVILFTSIIIVLFSFMQYFHLYFFQMNHEFSRVWQFGFADALSFVEQNRGKYKKVFVSNTLEQPYIFFLFYMRYDPRTYLLKYGGTQSETRQAFDIFEFTPIDWSEKINNPDALYILDPYESKIAPLRKVVHTIRFFDSSEAIILAE